MSPRHFRSDDFAERLLRMLDDAGADPHRLRIEITEVALLDDAPRALRMLNTLRDHGVLALLDDFGTGFSALSYLHRFPIQALKIDQSFVAGLDGETQRRKPGAGARDPGAGRHAGHRHHRRGHRDRCNSATCCGELGCTYGQGFLYGRPEPAADGTGMRRSS